MKKMFLALMMCGLCSFAQADIISEFEPNPAGGDPTDTTFELSGTANANFDLWILSLENDGFNGTVDRAANVTGTYDANGLAVVTTPDLENPSNTVILTDAFTGSIGDDLDALNDGNLDLSSLGTIMDAVAVSDNAGDDGTLYGSILGGTDILFNGEFEPLLVFRSGSTGDWFQTVTVDFAGPDEHVGVFAANGGPEIDPSNFDADPLAPTYGAFNPTFNAVPEPGSAVVLGLIGLVGLATRRRS